MDKLKISENGRYFVKPDGTPFVWLADTVWTIPQRLKWDDVDYLMKTRKSQGFTVLQIVALDPEMDVEMRSPSGEKALINDNLLTPNERYFSYLDQILDRAEAYGFYVLLLPVWGQLVVGQNWSGEVFEKTVTAENAFQYGQWIGMRYKEKNHILWCLGGDRQPIHAGVDYRPVWRLMAEGIAKGVTGKALKYNKPDPAWEELLMTYHACHEMETGECSTLSYWTQDEAWIRFIMLQSGHGLEPKNYELVKKEYNREKAMPVWDGEPAYERMPTSWPITPETGFHGSWMVRRRAYWSLLAGAFGFTYGHCTVWCSISQRELNEMNTMTWFDALHSEGAAQMCHLRAFMEDLEIMACHPAQELLPPENETAPLDLHQQCCVSPDGKTVCVYLPSGGTVQLDLNAFKTDSSCLWWYDPRDGRLYTSSGALTETAERAALAGGLLQCASPTQGPECDWLLIVRAEDGKVPIRPRDNGIPEKETQIKKVFEW